jgi:mono/diheme cytochrome c family protein
LYVSRGCSDCHGARGEGKVFMDGPPALLGGTNLTQYVQSASSLDFVRAVRHGVARDGRPLIFMPSHELQALNDEELSQIIAYTRSLPRVDSPSPAIAVRPLGNLLHTFGLFHLIPAELIDHTATRSYAKREASVAYGKSLAAQCTGCHGEGLSGGPIPGAPPELGNPRNLTPHASGLGSWKEADFVKAMREGVTPDGRHLNPAQMPWPTMGKLNDTELGALFAYLKTVPAKPLGSR